MNTARASATARTVAELDHRSGTSHEPPGTPPARRRGAIRPDGRGGPDHRPALHRRDRRDQFFAGQSAELAALVPGSTLTRFTQEKASYHCRPMAREITEQRMFDWRDEQIR
jgi:hypothetical protein